MTTIYKYRAREIPKMEVELNRTTRGITKVDVITGNFAIGGNHGFDMHQTFHSNLNVTIVTTQEYYSLCTDPEKEGWRAPYFKFGGERKQVEGLVAQIEKDTGLTLEETQEKD